MDSQRSDSLGIGAEPWIALVLCAAVLAARALEHLVRHRAYFAPDWIALAAIGLAAAGTLVSKLVAGGDLGLSKLGIAAWVPGLFYGSWLLWAIAAFAATRSYQLRTLRRAC